MTIAFEGNEVAAILAGLRVLQTYVDSGRPLPPGIHDILTNGGIYNPPDTEAISVLCDRINFEEFYVGQPNEHKSE